MKKLKDVILYKDDGYNSFPSIAADAEGTLYLTFRHAPDKKPYTHLDERSVAYLVKSTDGGETWSKPTSVYDTVNFGIQDPCIKVLKNGDIMITAFLWKFMNRADAHLYDEALPYPNILYKLEDGRLAYSEGSYTFISTDKGESFDGPFCIEKGYALSGQCIELPDGPLLAPLYGSLTNDVKSRVVVYASYNGGRYWEPYAHVWHDLTGQLDGHEPTLALTASGDLYCFIRTREYMCYCKSTNKGKTWTQAIHSDILSNVPCDLLRLKDDRMLLTYGRRHEPFGIRALLLDKDMNGITSENEFVLRDDGLGADISYNSSVQLPDGRVLATYYFYTKDDDERRHIAATWLSV